MQPSSPPVAPWPNAPADLSAIAWIPPPPIYGFPLPFGNMDPVLPHYYYPGGNPTEPASRASPCAVAGCTWPNVQDVPLPSAFPLPPALLSVPPPSFAGAPGLPPPLPWWVMEGQQQQQQQQQQQHHNVEEPRREPRRARRSSSVTQERATRRTRAPRTDAELPKAPHRRLSRPSQLAFRAQGGKRYQAADVPSSSEEELVAAPRPRRAASQHTPTVERSSDADVDEPPPPRRSRSHSESSLERKGHRRESVERKADIYLQAIEDVYSKLRASYEAFVRDPSLFLQGSAVDTSTTAASSSATPASTSSSEERAPRQAAPPREVREQKVHRIERETTRSDTKRSQTRRSDTAADNAVGATCRTSARAIAGQREPTATFTSSKANQIATSQLRSELLRLESQWQRLEELKQSTSHAKRERAAGARPSSSGEGATTTSAAAHTSPGVRGGSGKDADANVSSASQKFNVTREKIMALIQERKSVIGVR